MHQSLLVASQFYYLLPSFAAALNCKILHHLHPAWLSGEDMTPFHAWQYEESYSDHPVLPSYHLLVLWSHWRGADPQSSRNPFIGQLLIAAVILCAFCKHPPFLCAFICHYCHQQFSAKHEVCNGQELYSGSRGQTQISLWTRKKQRSHLIVQMEENEA